VDVPRELLEEVLGETETALRQAMELSVREELFEGSVGRREPQARF
jgi:hypothetical protein